VEKPRFQFSIDSDGSDSAGPVIVTDSDNSNVECTARDSVVDLPPGDEPDVNLLSEPASMPPLFDASGPTFSYKNPAYQSANPACGLTLPSDNPSSNTKAKLLHSSEQDIPGTFFFPLPSFIHTFFYPPLSSLSFNVNSSIYCDCRQSIIVYILSFMQYLQI
jgi:hypothetical protein